MSIKNKKIKTGDYVLVTTMVHDSQMPENRRDGLVVGVVGKRKDQAIVMFHNQAFLKFHTTQLKLLEKFSDND
tara:strand:- start:163 stop:381 length:219 start_codon:yes stop_codon:yes gene_type:complete